MDELSQRLDQRLRVWRPDIAAHVRSRVVEFMDLADADLLDVARSREVEQEVLNSLDACVAN
jgi:hypothetical protein